MVVCLGVCGGRKLRSGSSQMVACLGVCGGEELGSGSSQVVIM